MNEPVGKIGVLCGDQPLLDFVTPMAAAIAMGNRVTLVPSRAFPLAATDFIQILETSDVPAGVVNIVTGAQGELGDTLSKHMDVDAVWNLGDATATQMIEGNSAGNLKRVWAPSHAPAAKEFLQAATEVKNIWIPYGE
jgi:aldehyde dehydrogenase (NAD+)